MTRETVLANARVVLPDAVVTGAVVIRDGAIVEILEGKVGHGEDLGGDYLLPGLVELHTDHLELHVTPRPGTGWDHVPAVLAHDLQLNGAGVTTVFDAIRLGQAGDDDVLPAGRLLAEAITHAGEAGITRADHFIHLRCEVAAPTAVEEFEALQDVDAVRLASLMDHTPGQRQYADVESFRRYMVGKGRVSNEGFDALMLRRREMSAKYSDANRRGIAERAAARGITLAAHDDATVEHVDEAAALGVRICEFPTTEIAAKAAHERNQLIVMGAPNVVRGGSQSGNVAATGLLERGLLDVLSSDYVPASPLQAIFQLAADGALPLEQGVGLVSSNPARAVGLDDRGEITVGRRADLARVQTHQLPSTEPRPKGQCVPVVRAVYRQGVRVS
ncbi:MAG TPA: alpha-D-ribose 1-methylphosphonate 5-triphosphate diphosphatase [Acidimicrobiales bacterium]|nr:alpha-D-ribose 1-methylphosphonate 5-triphosphate diphosphatase [Acidimicrobiales bacterium]